MTEQRWQQVWEIYKVAVTLPVERHHSFLQSTGADAEVAGQVLALLNKTDSGTHRPPEAVTTGDTAIRPGSRIGRYRVWEAWAAAAVGKPLRPGIWN